MPIINEFCPEQSVFRTFHVFDDFTADQSDLAWVDTITDSGTVLIGDAASGVATLTPSDGTVTNNDETYFATANELFLVNTTRSLYFRTRIQFTEGNTDDVNIAVGFMNAVAANAIVDDGAGLKTTGNWFSIFKVDGETVWRANCRNSTDTGSGSALGTKSSVTAGGAAYQDLEIFIDYDDGVNVVVSYKVDGVYLRDSASSTNQVIRHRLPITSSTEMQAFLGIKNGADTTAEALLCDYVFASQVR